MRYTSRHTSDCMQTCSRLSNCLPSPRPSPLFPPLVELIGNIISTYQLCPDRYLWHSAFWPVLLVRSYSCLLSRAGTRLCFPKPANFGLFSPALKVRSPWLCKRGCRSTVTSFCSSHRPCPSSLFPKWTPPLRLCRLITHHKSLFRFCPLSCYNYNFWKGYLEEMARQRMTSWG